MKQSDGTYENHCWGAEGGMAPGEPKSGARIVLTECADIEDSHQRWEYHGTNLRLIEFPNLCMDASKIGTFKLAKCSNSQKQSIIFLTLPKLTLMSSLVLDL